MLTKWKRQTVSQYECHNKNSEHPFSIYCCSIWVMIFKNILKPTKIIFKFKMFAFHFVSILWVKMLYSDEKHHVIKSFTFKTLFKFKFSLFVSQKHPWPDCCASPEMHLQPHQHHSLTNTWRRRRQKSSTWLFWTRIVPGERAWVTTWPWGVTTVTGWYTVPPER